MMGKNSVFVKMAATVCALMLLLGGIVPAYAQTTSSDPVVPESSAVSDDYFKDAAFVGDSLMTGIKAYCGIKNAKYFAYISYNLQKAIENKITYNGRSMFLKDALAAMNAKKVYISMGVNDIKYLDKSVYIERYETLVNAIRLKNPGIIIYVQSISPIGEKCTYQGASLTKVRNGNEALKDMCRRLSLHYLDVTPMLAGSNGYLKKGIAAPDGLHLRSSGYALFGNFYRTHTYSPNIMVSEISLNHNAFELEVGQKLNLKAAIQPKDATNTAIRWRTNLEDIASVSDKGVVTAKAVGSVVIAARADDDSGVVEVCRVKVVPKPVLVNRIALNYTEYELREGETLQLKATARPKDATNPTVRWRTNKSDIAHVDEKGLVTARAEGKAVIAARANDDSGVVEVCRVRVVPAVSASKASVTAKSIAKDVVKTLGMKNMVAADSDDLSYYIDIKKSLLKESSLYFCGTGDNANTVAILKPKSSGDIKKLTSALEKTKKTIMAEWNGYSASEYKKAKNGKVTTIGGYAVLVISSNNTKAINRIKELVGA